MKIQNLSLLFFILFVLASCGKEFLDARRESNQVIPRSISDYQAILDERVTMNDIPSVEMGMIGSDEYYVLDGRLSSIGNSHERNGYIWAKQVYEGKEVRDWNYAYQRILYANMAMEVDDISPSLIEKSAWDNVKGSALFFRALNYYHLVQLFCKPYDEATASKDLGIPIKLDYDVTMKLGRGNLKQVYELIISDLEEAIELLPEKAISQYRPKRAAACALLARTYLHMGRYENAYYFSNLGLQFNSELIDYNALDLDARYPFPMYGIGNPEVLFFSRTNLGSLFGTGRFNADTTLLNLYEVGDLRRKAYFFENMDGRVLFKGSYCGQENQFAGLAVDELWLIRAECQARLGDVKSSMSDLNHLLRHRYSKTSFQEKEESNAEKVLQTILIERRKELYMRGALRWEDLRRLNKEPLYAISIVREIDGYRYELPPNDPRWLWPIPDNEISLSRLEQNMR